MNRYQETRKKGEKRITANTYDVLFAILRSIPATMENMRSFQKSIFIEAIKEQAFFCFTTTQSLITMANNTQEYKHIRMCKKTVYNQLELLLKVGILKKKENYEFVGKRNPRPEDLNTNGRKGGRGKYKLYVAPEVIHMKGVDPSSLDTPAPASLGAKEESLQQYILSKESTLLYKDTETKTIINTPLSVDNKAFADAKNSPLNIENTERTNKPLLEEQTSIPPANLSPFQEKTAREIQQSKRGTLAAAKRTEEQAERNNAARLWDFMCEQLYPGQVFNALARTQSIHLLQERLQEAKMVVERYRSTQLAQYKTNPAYIAAKNKALTIKRFKKRLPALEKSAFVIVANMIEKERKYSTKCGRLEELWYPPCYLSSQAGDAAMGYSKEDWLTLTKKYHRKNKASATYFKAKNWILACYYSRIQESHKYGLAAAEQTTNQVYHKWSQQLQEDPYLSSAQKEELDRLFMDTMTSIFNQANPL
ncbi:MAG: hypothetical protein ACRBFS_21735 [Aureispira sp.]